MSKTAVRASVHTIVETALMCGDLTPGASVDRMLEGVRGHQSLQSVQMDGVRNEVPVKITVEGAQVQLTVHGRIDRLHKLSVVEEIKTTLHDASQFEDADRLHWAQAECYGHMLCQSEGMPHLDLRITYLNLADGDITRFTRTYTKEKLAQLFDSYVAPYLAQMDALVAHRNELAQQMRTLSFPFDNYRAGQRELAAEIYLAIANKRMVLAQAPTGTGKTLAALFPTLKGFGQGLVERVFYLTARSTTRQAALDALQLLPQNSVRTVVLYSREKSCAQGTPICKSGLCPRSIGYYDRLPKALDEAIAQGTTFDRQDISRIAEQHELCPFELSLDVSLLCDIIVCDYNYIFDPRVRLQRYASGGRKGQVLLIDEAHNLPDRARGMYSAMLQVKQLDTCRKHIAKNRRKEPFYLSLRALIKAIETAAQQGDLPRQEMELREEIVQQCTDALCDLKETDALEPQEASQLSLELSTFIYHASSYDENNCLLFDGGKTTRTLTLFCADASAKVGAVLKRSRASVLFSATLAPMSFYRTLCGLPEDTPCVRLLSPFPPQNLMVLHLPVSTRYRSREATLPRVISAITSLVYAKQSGNFIAFFPSYAYLQQAAELIEGTLPENTQLLIQRKSMSEEDRADFLDNFAPNPTGRLLALCAMGGVFAEGIDLPDDRLSGAAIVGVGLPQIGVERDALKTRYEQAYGQGYDYAYVYPGMGKVLQAAGRIIRTPNDRGTLLLIDDRYQTPIYRDLMPPHWSVRTVKSAWEIKQLCEGFWQEE